MHRWKRFAAATVAAASVATATACVPLPSFTVNTTVDGADAVPGDGVCEITVGAGNCSLRAAVDEANAGNGADLSVPGGVYPLTVADGHDGDPDLDVTSAVNLNVGSPLTMVEIGNGASSGLTPVRLDVHETGDLQGFGIRTGRVRVAGILGLDQSFVGGLVGAATDAVVDVTATGSARFGNSSVMAGPTGASAGTAIRNAGETLLLYTTVAGMDVGAIVSTVGTGSTTLGGSSVLHGTWFIRAMVDAPGSTHCQGNAVASLGYNFAMGSTCGLTATGDVQNVSFGCSVFGTGATGGCSPGWFQVRATSPVVDVIPVGALSCGDPVVVDIFGKTRPAEGSGAAPTGCDVGAVELQP